MGKRKRKKPPAPPTEATAPPAPDPPRCGPDGWRGALALAALGVLLYVGTFGHGYLLDDLMAVRDNPIINEGRFADAVTTPYWRTELRVPASNWRPLGTLSWTMERAWAGPRVERADGSIHDPALPLYHGFNALLHGLVVLLLFPVAWRILQDRRAAWLACALFAVHPAHAEVVAPVVGRIDLLAALGALATLECWCRYRDTEQPRWLAAAAAAFALGLGGKESAAPMLVLLPLADRWLLGRPWSALRTRAVRAYLPILGVALLYGVARIGVLGGESLVHGQSETLGALGRVGFAARNTLVSAWLVVLPVRFHHLITTLPSDAPFTYPQPSAAMSLVWTALALPIWFGWLPLARRAPRAAFCWAAALAHWLPTSGIVPVAAGVALRFLFLSTAYVACGAVLGGRALANARPAWRRPVVGVAVVWVVAAAGLTLWRVPDWSTNERFFRAVLAEVPDCYKANYSVGAEIGLRGGDLVEARRYMQRAIDIAGDHPISVDARRNLAKTYEFPPGSAEQYGPGADLDRALAVYEAALAIVSDSVPLHHDLGALHEQLAIRARAAGEAEQARHHTERAVHHIGFMLGRDPEHWLAPKFHEFVAERQRSLGRIAEARQHFHAGAARAGARSVEQARRGFPDRAEADRQLAVRLLQSALECAPPVDEANAMRAEIQRLQGGR